MVILAQTPQSLLNEWKLRDVVPISAHVDLRSLYTIISGASNRIKPPDD